MVLPPSSSLAVFLSLVTFGEHSRESREAWPVQPWLKLPERRYEGVALEPGVTHRNVRIYVLLFAIIIKSPLPSYLREHINMLPENQNHTKTCLLRKSLVPESFQPVSPLLFSHPSFCIFQNETDPLLYFTQKYVALASFLLL